MAKKGEIELGYKKIESERSFTLIELINVLLLVAILAAYAIPRLALLAEEAMPAAEQRIIDGIRSAANLRMAENIVSGTLNSEGHFPSELDPFTFLDSAPPHLNQGNFGAGTQDGIHWRVRFVPSEQGWYIYCPHYNGTGGSFNGTRGTGWYYIFSYSSYGPFVGGPGTVGLWGDNGH